jgi:hypothetical protein
MLSDPTEQQYVDTYQDHDPPHQYKSFVFFENLARRLVPDSGIKIQLGVGWGHTLMAMNQHWGMDRVMGIDIINRTMMPNVWCIDAEHLTTVIPATYIENDIGRTFTDAGRRARWCAAQWGVRCLQSGGVMITSHDRLLGYPMVAYAQTQGCQVQDLTQFDHEPWAQHLNTQTPWHTENWLLIRRI